MGLLIDVSIDTDSIAKAAWARAVANRERLNRRLGTQRAVEEAVRDQPINTINGRALFNPLVTNYRLDDPVAPPAARQITNYLVAAGREDFSELTLSVNALNGSPQTFELLADAYSPRGQSTLSITEVDPGDLSGVPNPGTGVRGSAVIEVEAKHVTTVTLINSFALPTGGRDFVHCFWYRKIQAQTIIRTAEPQGRYQVTNAGLAQESLLLEVVGGTGSLVSDSHTVQTGMSCLLVTSNSIRSIEPPISLLQKMNQLAPSVNYTPGGVENIGTTIAGGFITDGVNPIVFYDPVAADKFVFRPPTFFAVTTPEFTPLGSNPLSLLGSGGSFFTPGIYTLINNPFLLRENSVVNANETTPSGWSLLTSRLGVVRPKVALGRCALDGTCTSDRIGFDILDSPESLERIFRRNTSSDIDLRLSAITPNIFAWDWGEPVYCRQQLLALGFTLPDLAV